MPNRAVSDADGYLQIGTQADPSSISAGLNLSAAHLTIKATVAKAKSFSDKVASRKVTEHEAEMGATQYADSDDLGGFAAIVQGDEHYVTYTDVTGAILFAGNAVVAESAASDQANQFGSRTIRFEATGKPNETGGWE